MANKEKSKQQTSEPVSTEEPQIRSRIFFKDNLSQNEPVIRSREVSKMSKNNSNKE